MWQEVAVERDNADPYERGAAMLKLFVYCHDVLRYTIFANWGKVQELRNQGFYVEVKFVSDLQ